VTSSDDFVLQLIIDRSLVSHDAVDTLRADLEATESIDSIDGAIIQKLLEDQRLSSLQLAELLAEESGAELVRLQDVAPQAAVLEALDVQVVKRYKVFPLEMDDYELNVAVFDPLDIDAIDNISHLVGAQ
jgi:general secretion pathway protein E/type IV pilus assembly protein PilB